MHSVKYNIYASMSLLQQQQTKNKTKQYMEGHQNTEGEHQNSTAFSFITCKKQLRSAVVLRVEKLFFNSASCQILVNYIQLHHSLNTW